MSEYFVYVSAQTYEEPRQKLLMFGPQRMIDWCKEHNITYAWVWSPVPDYSDLRTGLRFEFDNSEDAVLFKMVWG